MNAKLFKLLFWSFCLLQEIASSVEGVDIEAAFEQKCVPSETGFITKDFENWIAAQNISRLFFPMLSKLDVLRITQSLFQTQDVSFIHKRDIDNSCIEVQPGDGEFLFSGYCGQKATKSLTMPEPKFFTAPPTFTGDQDTTLRVSLSNNKDWQVMDVCWGDGQRSFAVLSSKPVLSGCDRKLIAAHLKAIGFNKDFFYGLRYEQCPFVCGGGVNVGIGLPGLPPGLAPSLQLRSRF